MGNTVKGPTTTMKKTRKRQRPKWKETRRLNTTTGYSGSQVSKLKTTLIRANHLLIIIKSTTKSVKSWMTMPRK